MIGVVKELFLAFYGLYSFFFFKVRGEEETETHIHNSQPYNKMPAAERNPKFVFLPPAVDGMSVSGGLVQSFAVVSSPPLGCLI